MVPWAHPSPQSKRHPDRFSRFCRSHDRDKPADRPIDKLRGYYCHRRICVLSFRFWPLIMAALWNGAGHYIFALWFLSSIFMAAPRSRCGHYIFALWFLLSFFLANLSRRRLVVYHTSTHGVALVRIYDAGLKRATSGSL